jgi:CHAD domain-containing protein
MELKTSDAVPKGIRKVVCKRIENALKALDGRRVVSDETVHEVRKRFREIRGTLRLVRDEMGEKDFRRENRTYRDASRPLSAVRDAKVLVDALDELLKHFEGRVNKETFLPLRRALQRRLRETRKQVLERDRAVSRIVRQIREGKKRVKDWPLEACGWRAIEGGLERIYRQGRAAMNEAQNDPNDEMLHEWRKRSKDLRYELELLQPLWPETIGAMAQEAHHLTDLLGQDHDLAVLRTVAREESEADQTEAKDQEGLAPRNELLFALIDERRQVLQGQSMDLGRKLYREGEKKFVSRLRGYWKAARGKTQNKTPSPPPAPVSS